MLRETSISHAVLEPLLASSCRRLCGMAIGRLGREDTGDPAAGSEGGISRWETFPAGAVHSDGMGHGLASDLESTQIEVRDVVFRGVVVLVVSL